MLLKNKCSVLELLFSRVVIHGGRKGTNKPAREVAEHYGKATVEGSPNFHVLECLADGATVVKNKINTGNCRVSYTVW